MSLHGRVVGSYGPTNTGLMLVGERPGENEAAAGRPFVGRAGKEQSRYLSRAGVHSHRFFMTNVCRDYAEGNPDPTPAEVERWTPQLLADIDACSPRYILCAGRFAARWFLGDDIDMEFAHGLPYRSSRYPSAVVIPVYHPAAGFYNDDIRPHIAWDYDQAAKYITGKQQPEYITDDYEGQEEYEDVTGAQLEDIISRWEPDWACAVDTEGLLNSDWHWSIQVSAQPGTGYVLRSERRDFGRGIDAIRCHCLGLRGTDAPPVTVIHSAMHDFAVTRAQGLDLFHCRLWDTRYGAYATRLDPQGLKPLARRKTGMVMDSYDETIGPAALDKQVDYLIRVSESTWPDPEGRVEWENDGTCAWYTPQPVNKRALAILTDFYSDKRDKDGKPVSLPKRWRKVDYSLRETVERAFGAFPIATLADIPLSSALRYAARDPDATLRVYYRQINDLPARLLSLVQQGNDVLPVFEEMQATGMLADREYMERKSEEMWLEMCRLQQYISYHYYKGQPFNPGSSDKVAAVMRRRGLQGEKRSKKTGKMSTAKKSIEHLRYEDDFIRHVIEWREHQKMRDSFYDPIIERIGNHRRRAFIHTDLNIYKVATRRVSSSDPNLTAIPVRNDLGVAVRDGFSAGDPDDPLTVEGLEIPPGWVLGSWDMSQIEMRYMAHISKDKLLNQFFNDPKLDVHCETAARIFHLPVDRSATDKKVMYAAIDEKKHRYPSKRAGFGIITNIMGQGLLDQLRMFGCKGWDKRKCDELIDNWLGVYTGVRAFLNDTKEEARRNGVVYDCWGMPRYLPGVWSEDDVVVGEAERAASSHKIQGGAQGMIQNAMIWLKPRIRELQEAGLKVRWVLQIHDELILMFEEELWEILNPLVREALTQHSLKLSVPIECSGSMARTWGKLK